MLIALLLAATLAVTAVYAATLARDITRQHWADALDASREAVLAVVGWAAVSIVLSADDHSTAEPAQGGDSGATPERHDESTPAADSVRQAQERVRRLRARLAELAAARERAGSGADPDLSREVASTVARLETARQWLSSAQSARTAGGRDPELARRPGDETKAGACLRHCGRGPQVSAVPSASRPPTRMATSRSVWPGSVGAASVAMISPWASRMMSAA